MWNPYCYIEQIGAQYMEATEHGIVQVIPVRMNSNLKTLTIEELREKKKSIHLACFDVLIKDIELDAEKYKCEGKKKDKILKDCSELREEHASHDTDKYLDPLSYQKYFVEMNKIKISAREQMIGGLAEEEQSDVIQPLFEGMLAPFRAFVLGASVSATTAFTLDGPLSPWHTAALTDDLNVRGRNYRDLLDTHRLSHALALIDDRTNRGDTAVILAIRAGHLQTLITLCEMKADINLKSKPKYVPKGGTSNSSDVQAHKDHDSQEHSKTNEIKEYSPLHVAVEGLFLEAVMTLRQYGAEPDFELDKVNFPNLSTDQIDEVKKVLEKDILCADERENSIWLAAKEGHSVRLQKMCELSDERVEKCILMPTAEGKNGAFPLWVAACNAQDKCVEQLLMAKAAVDQADKNKKTSLCIAVEFDHDRCVDLLIESRAQINPFKSSSGEDINHEIPVLWIAAFAGSKKCMEILLSEEDVNMDVTRTGPDGIESTPLQIAESKNHWEIVDQLKKFKHLKKFKDNFLDKYNEIVDQLNKRNDIIVDIDGEGGKS